MLLSDRLAQVYAGPEGPQVAAFFDFDGTLIHGFSAVDFYLDRIRSGKVGPLEAVRTTALALRGVETEEDFEKLVAIGLSGLDGHHQDDVTAVGERVFAKKLAARVYPEAWQLVQAHHRMGHTVVLASSATRFQLEAAARTLGIDHVLSTALEAGDDGILTGRADGPTCGGPARRTRSASSRRARHRPRGQLRLLQRQRGHRLPQPGRLPRGHHAGGPAPRARHRARAGPCSTSAAAACPACPPSPARPPRWAAS